MRVMDDPLWKKPGVLKENFQKARSQLGTSGHGNHFVEFGKLTVEADIDEPTLKNKSGHLHSFAFSFGQPRTWSACR